MQNKLKSLKPAILIYEDTVVRKYGEATRKGLPDSFEISPRIIKHLSLLLDR